MCWDVDFLIGGVTIRPGQTLQSFTFSPASPTGIFQWVRSNSILGPEDGTLFQDAGGALWWENLASQGTVNRIYPSSTWPNGIIGGARAVSEQVLSRAYIGLSNLVNGTDQPRQWDGTNLDRISQVGPGSPPSVPSSSVGASAQYTILNIQQPYPQHTINNVSWGATPNLYRAQPASNDIYFMGAVGDAHFTDQLNVGDTVYVSGVGGLDGFDADGTYMVASLGSFTDVDGTYKYFHVVSDVSNSDFARGSVSGTYQKTAGIVQLKNPIPAVDAVVGSKITISGNSIQGWNNTFPIIATPAEAQLNINSTSLTSNQATYEYTLQTGTPPGWQASYLYVVGASIVDNNGTGHVWQVTTPGTSGGAMPSFPASPSGGATVTDGGVTWTYQSGASIPVTVFNTNNGNGIFNVSNATIISATNSSFIIALTGSNVSAQAETGQAVSGSGSVLEIDPGTSAIGSGHPGTNPIYGTGNGGQVIPAGGATPQVASGVRYAVCMFLTRSGYITPASAPVKFTTTSATTQITFNNVPTGPSNVVARIIAVTLANAGIGGPYFWVPDDVQLAGSAASLGQTQTINKTVLNDNVSSSLGPVNFSDAVLSASINISEVGNNLQQQREIGEFVKPIWYKGRAFYLGERTKVDTLQNMTFDGGQVSGMPAGWNTSNGGIASNLQIVPSPIVNTSLEFVSNPSTPPASASTRELVTFLSQFNSTPTQVSQSWSNAPTPAGSGEYFIVYTLGENLPTTPFNLGPGYILQQSYTVGNASVELFYRQSKGESSLTWTVPPNTMVNIYGVNLPAGVVPQFLHGNLTQSGQTFTTDLEMPDVTNATLFFMPSFVTTNPASVWFMFGSSTPVTFSSLANYYWGMFLAAYQVNVANSQLSVTTSNADPNPGTDLFWTALFIPAGTPLNTGSTPTAYISQNAYQNFANAAIVQPNTEYSVRLTALLNSGSATQGDLIVDLYSPSSNTAWAYSIPLTSLTSTITEFIGNLGNPLWGTVPSDLVLRVYPNNTLAGTSILIDRIELFDARQPTYSTQVYGSYLDNPEAVDAVTGLVDIGNLTSDSVTNHFRFLDRYYLTTGSRTYKPTDTPAEPADWVIDEVSNEVGSFGPLAVEVGEEYVLQACWQGLYLFDGGNHVKISQEIQQIWDSIYQPSADTVWVRNDIAQQRILVGVPLPTPNQWLPNAVSSTTSFSTWSTSSGNGISVIAGGGINGTTAIKYIVTGTNTEAWAKSPVITLPPGTYTFKAYVDLTHFVDTTNPSTVAGWGYNAPGGTPPDQIGSYPGNYNTAAYVTGTINGGQSIQIDVEIYDSTNGGSRSGYILFSNVTLIDQNGVNWIGPDSPNVILACSYLSLRNGAEIASALAVEPSMFTGHLLWREGRRKWTIWQIATPYAAIVKRSDNSHPLWFMGSTAGQATKMDITSKMDNGTAIVPYYVTSPFPDTLTETELPPLIAGTRKMFPIATALIEGSGNLNVTAYPESLNVPTAWQLTQAKFPLAANATDDTNIPLALAGNRLFLAFTTDGVVGSAFFLKKVAVAMSSHPHIGVSGR